MNKESKVLSGHNGYRYLQTLDLRRVYTTHSRNIRLVKCNMLHGEMVSVKHIAIYLEK